jgi:DNA adenine methylase
MPIATSILYIAKDTIHLKDGTRVVSESNVTPPSVRPFLKWAGGKQWLSPTAPALAPKKFSGRYYEPFLGGGAFFFALEPAKATLTDLNEDLITTYNAVANHLDSVIKLLVTYPYEKGFFERIRSLKPQSHTEVAARFIYLNRTCWNGLYRVNQNGEFNTPFGRYVNPTICDHGRLKRASALLHRARIRCSDFENAVSTAKKGDFVYFDPPYITKHAHNGFLKYNAPLFSWEDQRRLAAVSKQLSAAGVFVLISNSAHESVQKLYSGFMKHIVMRRSLIGGSNDVRGWADESLISSYPLIK